MVKFMDIIGIICEYNPFHNGHLYHIQKIKEMYPQSLIILVLNGYFLERGEISIQTKEDKTKIALQNGIDIVLELPFIFGTQSSDTFANAAITLLNNYHVNKLIFGSECNDITKIKEIASSQLNNNFDKKIKKYLSEGLNYPTALALATEIDFNFTPNDLLGISYTKAILANNFNITPITIKRTNDYHDNFSNNTIISASNIRTKIKEGKEISSHLPKLSFEKIQSINENLFFQLLKVKIITEHHLNEYLDVDEGIEYRLKEKIQISHNLNEFIEAIKTKRYTYNKIKRMLIHILIGLKKEDNLKKIEYSKILGFSKKGRKYLNKIKDSLSISNIIDKESKTYQYEIAAALIYDLVCNSNTTNFEISKKPIIID